MTASFDSMSHPLVVEMNTRKFVFYHGYIWYNNY
jgi:hypothetical protein